MSNLPLPKDRNLYFYNQVDQDTIQTLTEHIIEINDNDTLLTRLYDAYDIAYTPKPINIYIDSYGGNVYQILGVVGVIEQSETPIHTYVTGAAFSAGFILLISGHKRYAHAKSTMMLHQLSSVAWGKLADMIDDVEENKRIQSQLDAIIVRKTGINEETLVTLNANRRDWYINAHEALKFGCVDSILGQ